LGQGDKLSDRTSWFNNHRSDQSEDQSDARTKKSLNFKPGSNVRVFLCVLQNANYQPGISTISTKHFNQTDLVFETAGSNDAGDAV
jgi:hypothetical protein